MTRHLHRLVWLLLPRRPRAVSAVDVDDTTRCPVAAACESCEQIVPGTVVSVGTVYGVLCMTLCEHCAQGAIPPPMTWHLGTPIRVAQHCTHLGCDLDEMDTALDAEDDQ